MPQPGNSDHEHQFKYIDRLKVKKMLFNDTTYIKEFSAAAIDSFTEFAKKYREYLLAEDETLFRKTGHKIKPIAQMIGVNEIVDEYEHGKDLMLKGASQEQYKNSAQKLENIINEIIKELKLIGEI